MRIARIAGAGLLIAAAIAAMVQGQPMDTGGNRPVMLSGSEQKTDPCTLGRIVNPDESAPYSETPLLVYPGDSTDLAPDYMLWTGNPVWLCDASDNMVGIVYTDVYLDPDLDCEVSSPVAEDRPYHGPCRWGWVVADTVEVVAG
jgi:hypothetical protein